jgi:hypothetical protein
MAGLAGAGGEAGAETSGGTGGAAGEGGAMNQAGAGMGGAEPCDGVCSGEKPVCDPRTETCVECTQSSQCGRDTPVCDTSSNTCVECTAADSSACADATPVCDTSSNTCVECTAADFSQCTGTTPVCDADSMRCVGCLTSNDCSSASASRCATDNTCVACTGDGDCTHLAGTQVCSSGICVQCTPSNETACGANSCNPATHQCTATARGSISTCGACLADSECVGGNQSDPVQRCVPMEFQGDPRPGGFCLTRGTGPCPQPYKTVVSASSLSGAAAENYCSIAQSLTTCEAVLDFLHSQTCSDGQDTSCGCVRDHDGNCSGSGSGGLCRTVGLDPKQCTYQCGVDNDCPSGKSCLGVGLGPTYCQ